MQKIPFIKMHGLGNDFVIVDFRLQEYKLNIKQICDRHFGVGCDQLITLHNTKHADVEMKIYNPDGSQAAACGNATRCVAKLLDNQNGSILVVERILYFEKDGANFSVNMGGASVEYNVDLNGYIVDVGNPHLVKFCDEITPIDLAIQGREFECHPFFPNRVNVSFVKIIDKKLVQAKVWERGAGETLACGSAACAIVFAGYKAGLLDANCKVNLPGGQLEIVVLENNEVQMCGPAAISFEGFL